MIGARLVIALAVLCCAVSLTSAVPVFVMLPLDVIDPQSRTLKNPQQLNQTFARLANDAHIDGFMGDVWWGLVERDGPKQYYWKPYQELVGMIRSHGLKFQATMSFHQCGGNVGDNVYIPIPQWVRSAEPKAFYTDREGGVNQEYISLAVDEMPLFQGRTPLNMYADYMSSFRQNVVNKYPGVVSEIQVGAGPAGELRYPSYHDGTYPHVGEFQCYDPYMLKGLAKAANASGHPEWGHGGPDNAGTYTSNPDQTGFWKEWVPDNYASEYGRFFLYWYSQALIEHGERLLTVARQIYGDLQQQGLHLSMKVSGVHWLYKTPSHAAECTAGYTNTNGENYYLRLASMFARYHCVFDFTCLELFDSDQCSTCGPQELVQQAHQAAITAGVAFGGENALPAYDQRHYNQIVYQASTPRKIDAFTYLRLGDTLMQDNNFNTFAGFVGQMHNLG